MFIRITSWDFTVRTMELLFRLRRLRLHAFFLYKHQYFFSDLQWCLTLNPFFSMFCPALPLKYMFKMLFRINTCFIYNSFIRINNYVENSSQNWPNLSLMVLIKSVHYCIKKRVTVQSLCHVTKLSNWTKYASK